MMRITTEQIDKIFRGLAQANYNADKAAAQYRKLSKEIEEAERRSPNQKSTIIADIEKRIKDRKQKDDELIGYWNTYDFNRGEVLRLSAVLEAIKTYKELGNTGVRGTGPSLTMNG